MITCKEKTGETLYRIRTNNWYKSGDWELTTKKEDWDKIKYLSTMRYKFKINFDPNGKFKDMDLIEILSLE